MPVILIDHPIMLHKLGTLRNAHTSSDLFRRTLAQMSVQMFYEAASDLITKPKKIEAAFGETEVQQITGKVLLVPLMRAGLGMIDPLIHHWPDAAVGHIGIYRDKSLKNTVEYYFKLPPGVSKSTVFVLDPIIATGDTAIASVDRLKETGCKDIKFISFLASEYGKEALMHFHPDIALYTISCSDTLDDAGYLRPGIGDVGARYYNTI